MAELFQVTAPTVNEHLKGTSSRDGCTTLSLCRSLTLRRPSCQDAAGWMQQNQAGEISPDTSCDLGALLRPCIGGGCEAQRAVHHARRSEQQDRLTRRVSANAEARRDARVALPRARRLPTSGDGHAAIPSAAVSGPGRPRDATRPPAPEPEARSRAPASNRHPSSLPPTSRSGRPCRSADTAFLGTPRRWAP